MITQQESVLSEAVIRKLQRDFGYVQKQNVNNLTGMKAGITNVVDHNFGIHTNCGDWCRTKQNSQHTPGLPYSRPLKGEQLYEKLKQVFAQFADESVASKLIESVDSQRNEAVHGIISTKAPKTRHYGSSASFDRRVAVAVTHASKGRAGVLSPVYDLLDIHQSNREKVKSTQWEKQEEKQKQYKKSIKEKRARNKRKYDRASKEFKQQETATQKHKTYHTGIGLGTSASLC